MSTFFFLSARLPQKIARLYTLYSSYISSFSAKLSLVGQLQERVKAAIQKYFSGLSSYVFLNWRDCLQFNSPCPLEPVWGEQISCNHVLSAIALCISPLTSAARGWYIVWPAAYQVFQVNCSYMSCTKLGNPWKAKGRRVARLCVVIFERAVVFQYWL